VRSAERRKTAWKRVSSLRRHFGMDDTITFSRAQRVRMQEALDAAGVDTDPSIEDVGRNGTVTLYPSSAGKAPVPMAEPPVRARSTSDERTAVASKRVFISYRRDDCQPQANGLNDGLRQRLDSTEIFMDVDSIPPGTDFEEYITNWIERSDIVLVLIGDNWLDTDHRGDRRLDDPNDFVRLEIRIALQQGKKVLPVCVEGAEMPRTADLPEDISRLARIQSIELSDQRWRDDVSRLAEAVRNVAEQKDLGPTASAQGAAGLDVPSKFTDKWFRLNVGDLDADELLLLTAELENRGWSPGEMIDRAFIYARPGLAPYPKPRKGDPKSAQSIEFQKRLTPAWLARVAPTLDDDQVARVVQELEHRRWSDGDIQDYFLAFCRN
jgi:hypothetical protein